MVSGLSTFLGAIMKNILWVVVGMIAALTLVLAPSAPAHSRTHARDLSLAMSIYGGTR